jgi:hypothetical protein
MTTHAKAILTYPLQSKTPMKQTKKTGKISHSHLLVLANEELEEQKGALKNKKLKEKKRLARTTACVCLASSLPPVLAEEETGS